LLAAVPIALFALTAAGVTFPDGARVLLAGLTLSAIETGSPPRATVSMPLTTVTADELHTAKQVFPNATLMSYSPPTANNFVHYFRFRQSGEPHPYGRSAVFVDGNNGEVLDTVDALQGQRSDRASNWLYPLHAVRVGGDAYAIVAVITALALAVMSVSGPVMYLKSLRRAGRSQQKTSSE
jgi:uncharacterized iron-regulated membrane protein